jgi:hypothetical protein
VSTLLMNSSHAAVGFMAFFYFYVSLVRVGYTTASADVTRASRLEFARTALFLSFGVGRSCHKINRNV